MGKVAPHANSMAVCFFQAPGWRGESKSLHRGPQPFLVPLAFPRSSFHNTFIWFFKTGAWQPNALGGDQQGPSLRGWFHLLLLFGNELRFL